MRTLSWISLLLAGVFCWPVVAQTPSDIKDCPPPASHSPEMVAKAALVARDRGFLWRIEREQRVSYLYGSLHVGKAEWMAPGPRMRKALRDVDAVALEVDFSSEASQRHWAVVRSEPQRSIPPALYQRLAVLWAAECLPPAQLGTGPVELQATALVALMGRREGYDPAYSSEMLLTLLAMGRKVPLISLENLKLQLDLILAGNDADATELVSQALTTLEKPNTRALQKRLTAAWERSDLAVLERFGDWCECMKTEQEQAAMKKLLDDRNPGMADAIARLHDGGQKVFAAVGALHMTGTLALPRLMAERGFKVERVF